MLNLWTCVPYGTSIRSVIARLYPVCDHKLKIVQMRAKSSWMRHKITSASREFERNLGCIYYRMVCHWLTSSRIYMSSFNRFIYNWQNSRSLSQNNGLLTKSKCYRSINWLKTLVNWKLNTRPSIESTVHASFFYKFTQQHVLVRLVGNFSCVWFTMYISIRRITST